MRARALIPAIILTAAVSMAGWSPKQLAHLRGAHEPAVAVDQIWADLLAYWALEDDAATTDVLDSHGTNYGTANKNTDLLSTDGKVNKAFDFGGSDGVNVGKPVAMQFTNGMPFSVSAWAYPVGADAHQRVFAADKGAGTHGYRLGRDISGVWGFYLDDTAGTALLGDGVITDTWTHIAGVYDGSEMFLYENGVVIDSLAIADWDPDYSQVDAFGIGYRPTGGANYFKGKIDEAAVFGRALSSNEVYRLFSEELTYP